MKKERIEELLISATRKCGHCLHWRFTHYDQGECERYQIPNTHKDDGGLCNGFKISVYRVQLGIVEFTQAINQAELEWYKKLEKKLDKIAYLHYEDIPRETRLYLNEIQNKIKELE